MKDAKQHWEKIYQTKGDHEVSWFQDKPELSMRLIQKYTGEEKDVAIIDVGGGNSLLAKVLVDSGYDNLSVLDISKCALERSKERILDAPVNWIESDILSYKFSYQFKVWHDRAVFHFLTAKNDIQKYIDQVSGAVVKEGYLILGTFSEEGPLKCSGLEITQYSKSKFKDLFEGNFELVECFDEVHKTPLGTDQNFIWVVFKRN
ncbi:methyltransferase domain-containing protein [Labilibacter sediminis]|nr:methyltransferase domain-containing protein [Labilibacter sediminis]